MPANYLWTGGEWSVDDDSVNVISASADKIVCECHGDTFEEALANALRIVKCCREHEKLVNSHRELLEALEKAAIQLHESAEEVESWGSYAGDYFQQKHQLARAIASIKKQAAEARAAIERART